MPINSFLYPGAKFTPAYEVANSCRFQDSDSSEMSRAIASTGSNTTWTVSAWVKRVELGQSSPIFGTGDGNANNDARMVFFDADDKIECSYYNSGYTYEVTTNRVFRDISAWYHICILFDTTESTSTDRIKIYVNGTQETSFATSSYPSEDATFNFGNTSYTHYVNDMGGRNIRGSHYIAELVYLDGTALAVTNFGEFDSDSPTIWKPKDVSGLSSSKGVNGFYMDFEDSSNLGNDVWGGTDFTESNLDAQNQSTDTCTNNFATWNSLFRKGTTTPAFAEGNLKSTFDDSGANEFALTTFGVSSGKWYAEVKWTSATGTGATATGILDMAYSGTADPNNAVTNAFGYFGSGTKNVSGTASSYGNSYTTGDIIGIAIDMDNNKLYFSKNGTFQDSGDPTSGSTGTGAISIISGVTYGIFTSDYNNKVAELNTGSPAYSISSGNADGNGYGNFEYSVPSGYYSLNTKNLAEYG
jgi:hypothetical protein